MRGETDTPFTFVGVRVSVNLDSPRGVRGFQSGKSVSGESDPPSAKEMIF